jgi:transketolase
MSVAYPNLPVVFIGFLPGIMTPGGVSHQAINDIATLRALPNMTIFDIGDATEIEGVLPLAHQVNGPVFIRMLRKEVPRIFPQDQPMELNRARLLSSGTDIALFSSSICTEEAIRATKALSRKGVSIQHLHVSTLRPFTDPAVTEALQKVKYGALTIENHLTIGGLGTAVAETIAEHGLATKLIKVGIRDTYTHGASKMYLLRKYGLDALTLISAAEELTGASYGITESDLEELRAEDYTAV